VLKEAGARPEKLSGFRNSHRRSGADRGPVAISSIRRAPPKARPGEGMARTGTGDTGCRPAPTAVRGKSVTTKRQDGEGEVTASKEQHEQGSLPQIRGNLLLWERTLFASPLGPNLSRWPPWIHGDQPARDPRAPLSSEVGGDDQAAQRGRHGCRPFANGQGCSCANPGPAGRPAQRARDRGGLFGLLFWAIPEK
jgi:hypothetical protein